MKRVVGLLLVLAIGYVGITFARQAFSNGMQTVIASETAPTNTDSSPLTTLDGDCVLGPLNDRPVNQNHCHALAIRAKQDAQIPENPESKLNIGMTKSDSDRTALWFGASMLALLLVLGGVGAGVMWMVKE